MDHARSSLFLFLLASVPLTRARTKPSARVSFMNKSEVSHCKCCPWFPCWQWALKQASMTGDFWQTIMIPNLHPASFQELNDPPHFSCKFSPFKQFLSILSSLTLQSRNSQLVLWSSQKLYQLKNHPLLGKIPQIKKSPALQKLFSY